MIRQSGGTSSICGDLETFARIDPCFTLQVDFESSSPQDFHTADFHYSYMRCMQANLAYLAADADRHHKQQKMLPGPAIMRCPNPENTKIASLYKKLQEIFPNWNGTVRPAQSSSSQSPVAMAMANSNVSVHQRGGSQEQATANV